MLNKEKHSPGNFCAPVQPTTMSGIGDHFEGEIQVQLRNMNLDDVEADEVEADEVEADEVEANEVVCGRSSRSVPSKEHLPVVPHLPSHQLPHLPSHQIAS